MDYIIIKIIKGDYNYFIKKFNNYNIFFYITKVDLDNYYIKVNNKDFELIKKIDYQNKINVYRKCGYKQVIDVFKKNIEKIIITILILFIITLFSNIILKINIVTNDKKLESLIKYALEDEKVFPYRFKKSYKELVHIKEKIKSKFSDEIEWLEIEPSGSVYNVYLIKKIKRNVKENHDRCNYVAKKSGLITSIYAEKGVLLVSENNYIRKNDILISGEIKYNEELKNEVCARGKIFGEVWYKVEVYIPVKKEIKTYVKTNKYNFKIKLFRKTYELFKNKYNNYKSIVSIGNKSFGLKLVRSYKEKSKSINYSPNKLEKIAINKARKSLLVKLPKNGKIIDEKVLKKDMINGKMYIEVLITTNEELGVVENY